MAKIGCLQPVRVSVRLGLVAAKNVPARRQQLRKGCVSYSLRGLAESRRGCLTTEGNATTVYQEHATFRPEWKKISLLGGETRGCKAFSTLTLYRYGNLRLVIASNVWGEVEPEVVDYRARFRVLQQIFRGRNVSDLGLCDRLGECGHCFVFRMIPRFLVRSVNAWSFTELLWT